MTQGLTRLAKKLDELEARYNPSTSNEDRKKARDAYKEFDRQARARNRQMTAELTGKTGDDEDGEDIDRSDDEDDEYDEYDDEDDDMMDDFIVQDDEDETDTEDDTKDDDNETK